MKKLALTLLLSILSLLTSAQEKAFQTIKKAIAINYPEMSLENKLIAYNFWSIDNDESRELNKSFEKNYKIYKNAKLKGGNKGMIVVAISKDNLTSSAVITLTKDGVTEMISVKAEEIQDLDSKVNNAIFDSNGNLLYTNLKSENVFKSINQLITR